MESNSAFFADAFLGASTLFPVLIDWNESSIRVTSIRIYIYSVIIIWLARTTLSTMNLLAAYGIYEFVARLSLFSHWLRSVFVIF